MAELWIRRCVVDVTRLCGCAFTAGLIHAIAEAMSPAFSLPWKPPGVKVLFLLSMLALLLFSGPHCTLG